MIESLASQFWLQKLGWTLLHFLWQGTAIALVYLALRALLGRSLSARGRYTLACLSLIAMVIAPPITFLLLSVLTPAGRGALPDALAIPWHLSVSTWQRLFPTFAIIWLTGVAGFSVRLFGGWRLTARLRSQAYMASPDWQRTLDTIAVRVKASWSGLNPRVRLLVSPLVGVPTVIGWLRPAILVPASALTGLPMEHITALLAHELAHIRRHDYLANMLQSVAEALLFYHPAVWWISGHIRDERELCCDDLAVAATDDALTYASALAELETIQPPQLRTVLAANGGPLLNRVRRLIDPDEDPGYDLPGAGSAWAMTVLLLAGVGVATVHAAQKPEAQVQVGNPEYPIPASVRPSPFDRLNESGSAMASHVRNTVLFDPFLSAQLARPGVTGNNGADGGGAPRFELASVRTSPRAATRMTGGFYGDDRFDVQSAEMLDLISIAYGVAFDKVVGGPNWLEWDRFDVLAKAPGKSTPDAMKLMLRTLLAERFHLVIRNDAKEQLTYALTAGHKVQLKDASGTGDSGCKLDFQKSPPDVPAAMQALTYSYTCRNTTMQALAEQIRPLIATDPNPILDETSLKGSYDFSFKFSFQPATRVAALFDALDKQLGLKLEPRMAPAPVLVVESVDRKPTADDSGAMDGLLANAPKEFEVADIKPSDPNASQGGSTGGFQPGGRVTMHGVTLRYLIWLAWNATPAEITGGPKFLDTDRFDLVGKAPADATTELVGEPRVDTSALRLMVRTLLVERFGLTTHTEARPVSAFTLTAVRPKLLKADPANRTAFHESAGTGAKDPRAVNPAIGRLVTCTNMTMAQFAENLPIIAGGYFGDVSRNVLDATGLEGAYDFSFSFSGASTLPTGRGQSVGGLSANGVPQAPDPSGAITLFDALEKQLGLKLEIQKRNLPVLVIDQIYERPTDN